MSGDLMALYERVQRAIDDLARRFKGVDELLGDVEAALGKLPGMKLLVPPVDKRVDAREALDKLPPRIRDFAPACRAATSLGQAASAWSEIESGQARAFVDRFEVSTMAKERRGWAGPGAEAYSAFVRDNHDVAVGLDASLKKAVRKLRECDQTTHSWLTGSLTNILQAVVAAGSVLYQLWNLLGKMGKMCAEVISLFQAGRVVAGSAEAVSALAVIDSLWAEVVSGAVGVFITIVSVSLAVVSADHFIKKMIEDAAKPLTDIAHEIMEGRAWRKASTLPAHHQW